MTKRLLLTLLSALALSACTSSRYDFQPEDEDKRCGVVLYDDGDRGSGKDPIGRYCQEDGENP